MEAQAKRPEHDVNNPDSLLTLDGRPAPAYGNTFKGRVYNASDRETITQVEIALAAISGRDTTTRVYRTNVYVFPRSASDFTFEAVLGDYYTFYEWRIHSAKGFYAAP